MEDTRQENRSEPVRQGSVRHRVWIILPAAYTERSLACCTLPIGAFCSLHRAVYVRETMKTIKSDTQHDISIENGGMLYAAGLHPGTLFCPQQKTAMLLLDNMAVNYQIWRRGGNYN